MAEKWPEWLHIDEYNTFLKSECKSELFWIGYRQLTSVTIPLFSEKIFVQLMALHSTFCAIFTLIDLAKWRWSSSKWHTITICWAGSGWRGFRVIHLAVWLAGPGLLGMHQSGLPQYGKPGPACLASRSASGQHIKMHACSFRFENLHRLRLCLQKQTT